MGSLTEGFWEIGDEIHIYVEPSVLCNGAWVEAVQQETLQCVVHILTSSWCFIFSKEEVLRSLDTVVVTMSWAEGDLLIIQVHEVIIETMTMRVVFCDQNL